MPAPKSTLRQIAQLGDAEFVPVTVRACNLARYEHGARIPGIILQYVWPVRGEAVDWKAEFNRHREEAMRIAPGPAFEGLRAHYDAGENFCKLMYNLTRPITPFNGPYKTALLSALRALIGNEEGFNAVTRDALSYFGRA